MVGHQVDKDLAVLHLSRRGYQISLILLFFFRQIWKPNKASCQWTAWYCLLFSWSKWPIPATKATRPIILGHYDSNWRALLIKRCPQYAQIIQKNSNSIRPKASNKPRTSTKLFWKTPFLIEFTLTKKNIFSFCCTILWPRCLFSVCLTSFY